MTIIQNLVPESKYSIKCPYEMTPTRIVVHNTANDASAKNEVAYMIRNNNEVSFHYAVDDIEVVQGILENRNAWHAGDGGNGKGNREGIAVEICYSKSGGDKFTKAEKNAAKFIAEQLKIRGWGVDRVTKHQDYKNKYCPHRTLDLGWDRFIKMIEAELDPKQIITPQAIKKGDKVKVNKGAKSYEGKGIASFVYNGTYTIDELTGNRAVLDKKGICTAFNTNDLTIVTASAPTPAPAPATIKIGSTVNVNNGAKTYTGGKLAQFVYTRNHKVKEIKGDRAVITYSGIVVAAVNIKDLTLV
jgi:N-acetylmuramoyl-L-alanine amidase CwlA